MKYALENPCILFISVFRRLLPQSLQKQLKSTPNCETSKLHLGSHLFLTKFLMCLVLLFVSRDRRRWNHNNILKQNQKRRADVETWIWVEFKCSMSGLWWWIIHLMSMKFNYPEDCIAVPWEIQLFAFSNMDRLSLFQCFLHLWDKQNL